MEDGSTPPAMLTRSAFLASEVTADNGSTSTQDTGLRESMSTEWTDEKHSLFLKSMEASFVNDLYNYFDSPSWQSQRELSSDSNFAGRKRAHTCVSSNLYKVLRGGWWEKVNFERHKSRLDKADRFLLANPWIQHFRPTCRQQIVTPPRLEEKSEFGSLEEVCVSRNTELTSAALVTNLKPSPLCHSNSCWYDSVGSNKEVTDQNFVDEDIEGDNARRIRNSKRKKKRSDVASTSSNDQVVPFSEYPDVSSSDLKSENENGLP
ncbi:Homeobox protein like [Actinidia chinensis var. chinensis]|uniref:Homeobox protein like n=1 Tax=Actinidia chinensis var. chinensis TaxID=1590841 RepID=A0A2R6QXZ0_ACTCC|nr:Homeobox protein like [Actinidia chinensis var. chinensis]